MKQPRRQHSKLIFVIFEIPAALLQLAFLKDNLNVIKVLISSKYLLVCNTAAVFKIGFERVKSQHPKEEKKKKNTQVLFLFKRSQGSIVLFKFHHEGELPPRRKEVKKLPRWRT